MKYEDARPLVESIIDIVILNHKSLDKLRFGLYQKLDEFDQRARERNFCERCGKRLSKDHDSIHTCTPPADLGEHL